MGLVERRGVNNTRSFSIDEALDEELMVEAEKQDKSVSRLIDSIIENYLNYQRWIDSHKALTIRRDTMMIFLDYLSEDDMRLIGERVGSSIPRRSLIMRGMPLDENALKVYLESMIGGWDNWFEVTYHEGSRPYLYIRNQMGSKWIAFIESHIVALYGILGKEVSCVRVGDNLQVLL